MVHGCGVSFNGLTQTESLLIVLRTCGAFSNIYYEIFSATDAKSTVYLFIKTALQWFNLLSIIRRTTIPLSIEASGFIYKINATHVNFNSNIVEGVTLLIFNKLIFRTARKRSCDEMGIYDTEVMELNLMMNSQSSKSETIAIYISHR